MITLFRKSRKSFNTCFKRSFALCLFCLLTQAKSLEASFLFDKNCAEAYSLILQMRLKEARVLINDEKKADPHNSMVILLDNYHDYFSLISSDKLADYEAFKKAVPARLDLLEAADRKSPWYYYSQAEINLQYAFMRARFQEYWGAAWSIRRASGEIADCERKNPGFLPAEKCRGIMLAMLGSVPSGLKLAMGPLGLKGNTQEGLALLERSLAAMKSTNHKMAGETALYLSYLQSVLTDRPGNYTTCIKRIDDNLQRSPLTVYVKSYIALHHSQTADALKYLQEKPFPDSYEPFVLLDYYIAVSKLNRLDGDAISWFRRFLGRTHGVSFIKDAYLRIAWIYRLNGNLDSYMENLQNVTVKGYTYQERDKQALREAGETIRYPELLRARLLFDGGFFDKAQNELRDKDASSYADLHSRLDFLYRSGRIEEALNNKTEAITYYVHAVELGKNASWYYAANASLHLGMIYESMKDIIHARDSYQQCLEMKEDEYKSSIDNKARAALDRLNR